METTPDYIYNIVLIGEDCVGKSSLSFRFVEDSYYLGPIILKNPDESGVKRVEIENNVIDLYIRDLCGPKRIKPLWPVYSLRAQGIIIVYDVTDRLSFDSVNQWWETLTNVIMFTNKDAIFLLVGNKSDLEEWRAVTYEEGKELADFWGINFIETSAKTSSNVEELFLTMAWEINRRGNCRPFPHPRVRLTGKEERI